MKALRLDSPGRCSVIELDRPKPGPGEVLIEVRACTVCNQHDLRMFSGEARDYPAEIGFPGHEGAGVVAEAGGEVEGVSPGDKVVTSGIGGPPLYREYVSRRADAVAVFRRQVPFEHAAPMELYGCVHRALAHASCIEGRDCAVVGLGPAGLACAQLLRAKGAARIRAYDPDHSRRERALGCGADSAQDVSAVSLALGAVPKLMQKKAPSVDEAAALEELKRDAPALVFDCSGSARGVEGSFLLAREELVIFGFTTDPITVHQSVWFGKELVIRNSKILSLDDLRAVASLLDSGAVDPGQLVTHVLPFSEYARALELVRRKEAVKVALVWEN